MAINYYTYNSTTKQLTPVHGPIRTARGWVPTPTAAEWAERGAYPNGNYPPPTPPQGKIAVADGFALRDNVWERLYRFEDAPPPPPRKWSRLSIKTALATAGMLAAARSYLSAVEIATGYAAWEALTDCDYIEEGYPDAERWSAILDGAESALGKTRAEIDAFLAQIPQEGY